MPVKVKALWLLSIRSSSNRLNSPLIGIGVGIGIKIHNHIGDRKIPCSAKIDPDTDPDPEKACASNFSQHKTRKNGGKNSIVRTSGSRYYLGRTPAAKNAASGVAVIDDNGAMESMAIFEKGSL
jgi:hypothetical protein